MSNIKNIVSLLNEKQKALSKLSFVQEDTFFIKNRTEIFSIIAYINRELMRYESKEIEQATKAIDIKEKIQLKKKLVTEIEEIEEDSILFLMIALIILMSDKKNKMFMLIALQFFISPTNKKKIYRTSYK